MSEESKVVVDAPSKTFGDEVREASSFVDDYMVGGRRTGVLCANPDCRWHTEVKGGTFNYSSERRGFFCDECFHEVPVSTPGKNLWDFTTTHLTGKPIHITSVRQLDRLCRQYGVSNQAREMNQSNWDVPPSVQAQKMNPELERLLGRARECGRSEISGGWNE